MEFRKRLDPLVLIVGVPHDFLKPIATVGLYLAAASLICRCCTLDGGNYYVWQMERECI